MNRRDPRDVAIAVMVSAVVVIALALYGFTRRSVPIDEGCWFDFQCETAGGTSPRCSSWSGGDLRCTLTCVEGEPNACPGDLVCRPAEMRLDQGGTRTALPIATCRRH